MQGADDLDRATSYEGIAVPTAALEGAELFAGLDRLELTAAASLMRFRSFEAGETICREGDPGDSMFVIVDGLVHLLVAIEQAPEDRSRSIFDEGRLVGKLRRGDVVGTGSLITGEHRSATATAAVGSDLLELGRDDFRTLIARSPRVLENLTRILTRRLAEVTSRQARSQRRGEVVAVPSGPALAALVPALVEAAATASPRSIASLDATQDAGEALAGLDRLLREHATVVLLCDFAQPELPQLFQYVDRTLALLGDGDEADRFGELAFKHAVRGQPIEAVLAKGIADPDAAGDSVRVVRRLSDGTGHAPEDIAWLGRHVAGTKLGLALGAGGAKGYALVGALAVLEEAGYTVDFVSGSSIGAIVGTWIALGRSAGEIEAELRAKFTPERVAETLKISLSGQASGYDEMVRLLRELVGEQTFADTTIPLAIMTADLTDRMPAPLREGSLAEALIAATALAGVFPPHELHGHRLVDGLAIEPVPTAAVIEDGADVTVSVNLIPRRTLPAWPGSEPPPAEEPRRRGSRMLDTLLEVMDLAQLDTSERGAALADIVVTPRFGPGSWRDFHLADRFLTAGRVAMQERMPALQELARPQFAATTDHG